MIGDDFAAVLMAAQEGAEASFAVLWRDANPPLLRYLKVVVPEAAEDVAAETWVTVIRGLGAFIGDEANWRAWLFTVARSRAIDEGRRRRRRPASPLDEAQHAAVTAAPDTADVAIANLETERAVALIGSLPPLQAEAIMLRVVAGLDTRATAELLGRSPGAVRVAAHRGLRRLAAMLSQAGVTL